MKPVTEMLAEAPNEDRIRYVLNYANWTNPTGHLRRIYIRAANKRRKELNENSRQ